MSRYVVRVIGPAGGETYLTRGHETGYQERATHYPHPSNAWQAAKAYGEKAKRIWPCPPIMDVIDTRNPESQ